MRNRTILTIIVFLHIASRSAPVTVYIIAVVAAVTNQYPITAHFLAFQCNGIKFISFRTFARAIFQFIVIDHIAALAYTVITCAVSEGTTIIIGANIRNDPISRLTGAIMGGTIQGKSFFTPSTIVFY